MIGLSSAEESMSYAKPSRYSTEGVQMLRQTDGRTDNAIINIARDKNGRQLGPFSCIVYPYSIPVDLCVLRERPINTCIMGGGEIEESKN